MDADNDYKEIARDRIPAKHSEGYDKLLQNIKQLISTISQSIGSSPVKVGIGTPGIIDEERLDDQLYNTCLLNKPFVKIFQTY